MPTEAEKLADLRALYLAGTGIEVVELVKVSWPAPTGDIYYVSTLDDYLLRELSTELPGITLDLRLPGREFQDILNDTTISDDTVRLKLWDGDAGVSDLANEHGAGHRVEIFYWFPQVSLLLSEWFGHRQPSEESSIDQFQMIAEVGFMSSMLPLPRRAFFNTCSAMFGGWLHTQAEIDEGDCPYNRQLTAVALDAFVPTNAQNVDTSGGGVIKNAGGTNWNAGASHSVVVNEGDEAIIKVTRAGPYAAAGFATTASPRNSNTDFLVNLQWNPDGSVTIQSNTIPSRPNATASVSGDELEVHLRGGRFRFYKAGSEIVLSDWTPPAPVYPLYLGIAAQIEGAGVTLVEVKVGASIPAPARGNLDPATAGAYTDCARTRPHCIARLGDDLNYLGFDTVIQSYVVGQTKGPAITVTTRGNESNLKRPLRVIAGKRHVSDVDVLAFTVEPSSSGPERGFAATLSAPCEGPIKSINKPMVQGIEVAPEHRNLRLGTPRQSRTGFSAQVSNYSSTAVMFLRAGPGDFTKVTAEELRIECDIEGSTDVRRYTSETTFIEEYSTDRAWWLLHVLRNKRWGYGLDVARFMIEEDLIPLATWAQGIVSFTDADGTVYTGPRTTFNAELIDRTVQQQVNDICLAGRFSLPYVDHGKLRIKPLSAAPELLLPAQFTEKAFLGSVQRVPTGGERDAWVAALETAIDTSEAALLTEARSRVKGLFTSAEYVALATTDEQFVTDLYAAYLARVAEPEGRADWLEALGSFTRSEVCDGFGGSVEFATRVGGMMGVGIPLFSDRGSSRNIVWENDRTTVVLSQQTDATLPNRVIVNFDDAAHQNGQRPLVFEGKEGIDAQLRAGRAFGDTTRRAVEKTYTLLGVTDLGEATRMGNLLLHLGEFDEGGLFNNHRVKFTAWYADCVLMQLRKYKLIKVDSERLDRLNDKRAAQGLEPVEYFRIRTMRRLPNLKVEISAQFYPREYYDTLESWTTPPPIVGVGGLPNPGGDPRRRPGTIDIMADPTIEPDRIRFRLANEVEV